jgi:small conductance mechanosensitive channel
MVGTVTAVGLFGNTINMPDDVRTIVGNAFRRVDLVAQLDQTVDHNVAIGLLREGLNRIPNLLKTPVPDIEILTFTPAGTDLAVRQHCAQQDYWQIYFDTNRFIRESFGGTGFPVPEEQLAVRSISV